MDVKEKREMISAASNFFGAERSLESIAFELCTALEQSQAEVERLRGALETYGLHGVACMAGQSRAGRPTEDGGYETLYGYGKNEKWYKRGEFPECTCGLSEALKETTEPEGEQG